MHEVGLRLNACPVPGACPNSVVVIEVMWTGTVTPGITVALFGMLLIIESRP
jgi:hypothetical protein